MKVHQAYFGDREGSHNLIASSISNKTLIGFLKLNTDIPASITIDKPYLSASKVDDFYVLTKTMNDAESERPGMGFSHCIIIPVQEIEHINNLEDVFNLFVSSPKKSQTSLPDLELSPTPLILDSASPTYNNLIAKLVSNKRTVVYLGYDYFENDIVRLWSVLSKELRENLSFTISGSPNEIENENFTIVHSPESAAVRWTKHPLVKNQPEHSIDARPNRFLIDPTNPESLEFGKFIRDNSIHLEFFNQYPNIEKLFRLSKEAIANPEPVLLKRVINLIGTIIPNTQQAQILKKKILGLFIENISTTETSGIFLLRNMKFDAFAEGIELIRKMMASWTSTFMHPSNSSFFPSGIKLLQEAHLPANPEWWKIEINKQFVKLCQNKDHSSTRFIWSLWSQAPELILVSKIPLENEQLYFDERRKVADNSFYQNLSQFCKLNKWFKLYAESVSYELNNVDAINAQITLDKGSRLKEHLEIIRDNITDRSFLNASISVDNLTVHGIAGQIIADSPELLTGINLVTLNAQKIWYQSFLITKDINKGIENIEITTFEILDLIVENQNFVPELLMALAPNVSNIFHHRQRKEIWKLIPVEISSIFIEGTAIYIVENFEGVSWDVLEKELKTVITSENFLLKHIIKNTHISVKSKIDILLKINKLNDDRLRDVVDTKDNINYLEAELISSLVKKFRFLRTLHFIFWNRSKNQFFPNIVDSCKDLLSTWDRMWLKSGSAHVPLNSLKNDVDNQNLDKVFKVLSDLGVNDTNLNRLKEEYVAGVKGIDLIDLCKRLKTYLDTFQ